MLQRGSHEAGGQGTVKSGEGALKARSGSTPSWRLSPGPARHADAGGPGTSVASTCVQGAEQWLRHHQGPGHVEEQSWGRGNSLSVESQQEPGEREREGERPVSGNAWGWAATHVAFSVPVQMVCEGCLVDRVEGRGMNRT